MKLLIKFRTSTGLVLEGVCAEMKDGRYIVFVGDQNFFGGKGGTVRPDIYLVHPDSVIDTRGY